MTSLGLLFLLLQAPVDLRTAPAAAPRDVAFPGWAVARHQDVVEMRFDPNLLDGLRANEKVTLRGFPWGAGLELQLEQHSSPVRTGAIRVNGQPTESLATEGSSFWSGEVVGEADSDAFLAFAGGAAWGWVLRADELVHVVSIPDRRGDWGNGTTLLVTEAGLRQRGLKNVAICGTEQLPSSGGVALPDIYDATAARTPGLLHGTLAVESDFQFFQIFGNLAVAEGYVMALMAAANLRFHQFDVHMSTIYMGFYTTPADPWTSPDTGTSICFDMLFEFQAAWSAGGAPVDAHLNHFLSGVDLGCGVAFLDAVCDDDEGFSVMSRMDGLTPFPVVAGPLNWDFVWICHELGHNFGSPHTHQYCPPIDECAPQSVWGDCQDEVVCTNQAGLMSYCHACPGGMANFTTWFHPVAANTMRLASEASCLQPAMVSIR